MHSPARKVFTNEKIADALASDAYTRGRRAGLNGLTPAANEFQPDTAEHAQWLQGLRSVPLHSVPSDVQ